jgi:hypothetical protein
MVSKQVTTRARAIGRLFSENPSEGVLASMLVGLLIVFVVVVAREVIATLTDSSGYQSNEFELIAVSITGVVGGVFAVFVSREQQRPLPDAPPEEVRIRKTMGAAFAVTYIVAGVIALAVCLVKLDDATSLLRSLAATFLGTSVAAATALFGTQTAERSR